MSKQKAEAPDSPVIDTLEDESKKAEHQENACELDFLFLKLFDVGVDGDAQQDDVFSDEDQVKDQLSAEGRHVLEGFGEGVAGVPAPQGVHANPVVNVDVGQTVADHVMPETQVQPTLLLPILFGIAERNEGIHQSITPSQNVGTKFGLLKYVYD